MTATSTETTHSGQRAADPDMDHVMKKRVPGHKVFENTAHLPEAQMLAIRWFHSIYYDSGRSLGEAGKLIGYDGGTVSKVFHGKYEGDLGAVAQAIERYRALAAERATVNKAPFIETALYREIEECCQAALTYQKIVFIYGESQIGKTTCLKHYAETHNHGETVYVEMPVGGSLTHFLAALAEKVRTSVEARDGVLQLNLMKSLGPRNLLIVDEPMRALQAKKYGGSALKTLDFIRALHDNTGCGVVLAGTNIFRDQMADLGLKKFLNQINRRCLLRRQLDDKPTRADLNAFARHFGLEPATGEAFALQKAVTAEHGLGVWLTSLTAANRKAQKEGAAMTWDHVIRAHAFFRRMEQHRSEEEAA
jgi:DNA transposition AAA+ family ATPase